MPLSSVVGAQSIIKPGVCTSSTRPAVPFEGQMIYETDTDKVLVYNGTAWYANWNMPWGFVGRSTIGTSVGTTTTQTDMGLSITFTAIANRYYKYSFFAYAANATAAATLNLYVTDSANATKYVTNTYVVTSQYNSVSLMYTTTETAGSTTRKIRASLSNNTGTLYADASIAPATFLIEDIGPA